MITSTSNKKVSQVAMLRRKRQRRDKEGLFLAEGLRLCREIPPERLEAVYVTEEFWERHREELHIPPERIETVTEKVYAAMTDTENPQGILAVVRQTRTTLEQLLDGVACPALMVLERVQDPGNLGTIIRTAEASGMTGVILSAGSADLYNPKVVRSTMGSLFRLPVAAAESLPDALEELTRRGIKIYAAALEGSTPFDRVDYRCPAAILVGNEGNGLSEEAIGYAHARIRIPMEGRVESMNAAVSAALLMYEVHRQRHRD